MSKQETAVKLKKDHLSWFDHTKYDQAIDWDVSDWNRALSMRFLLQGLIDKGEIFNDHSKDKTMIKFLLAVLENPAPKKTGNKKGLFSKGKSLVRDIELIDIFDEMETLKKPSFNDVLVVEKNWHQKIEETGMIDEIPEILRNGYVDYVIKSYPKSSISERVTIDLNGSDFHIIEDFKKWLSNKREARKSLAPKKAISDSELLDWYKYRVLAFIDINLFCHATETKISDSLMGKILFPEEFDVDLTERIRKVIRPKVDRIMKSDFISSIDEQVARMNELE